MVKKTKSITVADDNATSFCWLYHWCHDSKQWGDVDQFISNFQTHLVSLGENDLAKSLKSDSGFSVNESIYDVGSRAQFLCQTLAIKHGELSERWFESPCGGASFEVPQSPLTSVSDFHKWFGDIRDRSKRDLLSRDKSPTGADAAMLWIDVRRALIWLDAHGFDVQAYKRIMRNVIDAETWITKRETDAPRFDDALTELENLLRLANANDQSCKLTESPLSVTQDERDELAKRKAISEAWERTNAIRKTMCESWDRIYSNDWNTIAVGLREFTSLVLEFGFSERVNSMIETRGDDKRVWAWKFVKHALDEPVARLAQHLAARAEVDGTAWKSVFNHDLPQLFFTDKIGVYTLPAKQEPFRISSRDDEPENWTDWMQPKILKDCFGFTTSQGWTSFANSCRNEGLMTNHPQSGPKCVSIHRSVFTRRSIPMPSKAG